MQIKFFFAIFFVLYGLVTCTSPDNGSATPLFIGALFELSEHWWSKYTGFFSTVVELAFEGIRNNSAILPGYDLKLMIKDTQGKAGLAAKCLDELLQDDIPKVAILGPGLSNELTLTGQIAPFYNVIEMSYVASTSSTVDRELFPTLFKVNQIQEELNPVRLQMMKYFGWTKVATLLFQDDVFVTQMNNFHASLKENNMTLLTSALISDEESIPEQIQRLKDNDARIIMGGFRSTIAPYVFCEVYKQGMYGNRYVWLLDGPSTYEKWITRVDESKIPCSKADLYTATMGHFTLNFLRLNIRNTPSISGMTPTEFDGTMNEMLSLTPYKKSRSLAWLYDSVWAIALGLNNSIAHLNGSSLEHYNYSLEYLEAFKKGFHEVNFQGVSGPVAFDEGGGRLGVTYIQHNLGDDRKNVGIYDQISSKISWLVPVSTLWAGGEAPRDEFEYREMLAPASVAAVCIILVFNTVGCCLAVAFLVFNIKFRNNRNIKLSSPLINNVIVGGSFILYLAVYLAVVDYSNFRAREMENSICMVRGWAMSIGFTMLFGALFSKTWRVHVIFRQQQLKRRAIRDVHLFAMLGMLMVVDCLILTPWTTVHSLVKREIRVDNKDFHDNNIIAIKVYRYCSHEYEGYWFAAMYVYKGLLLAFGTFLAWETRAIKVAALNDSKQIGFCVYNVVIVCMFGVPLAHVLPIEQTTLSFVLVSGFIIFCTTVCLCILFVPKIRLRNEVQEKSFVSALQSGARSALDTLATASQDNRTGCSTDSQYESTAEERKCPNMDVRRLMEENNRFRMEIAQETIALAKLKRLLLKKTGNLQFQKVGKEYKIFQTPFTNNDLPGTVTA